MLNNDELQVAEKQLIKGRTMETVARFFGITKKELEDQLNEYLDIYGDDSISKRISVERKTKKTL